MVSAGRSTGPVLLSRPTHRVAEVGVQPVGQLVDACCDLVKAHRLLAAIPLHHKHGHGDGALPLLGALCMCGCKVCVLTAGFNNKVARNNGGVCAGLLEQATGKRLAPADKPNLNWDLELPARSWCSSPLAPGFTAYCISISNLKLFHPRPPGGTNQPAHPAPLLPTRCCENCV